MPKIINFGSMNIDYVYNVPHIIIPGETLKTTERNVFAGGKGLNQSIAAARAGASVIHAGSVGGEGGFLIDLLKDAGADASYVSKVSVPTGHTVIQVDENGQNSILFFAGANVSFTEEYIDKVLDTGNPGDFVLLQNETNMISGIIEKAHARDLKVVFNPSPFPEDLGCLPLESVDIFMVNEIEGALLAGAEGSISNNELLGVLSEKYPAAAIVMTLGTDGVIYSSGAKEFSCPAIKVNAVDTTAAGDTFCGYFLAGLCEGICAADSLKLATAASAIAVSRPGAVPSIPNRAEANELMKQSFT